MVAGPADGGDERGSAEPGRERSAPAEDPASGGPTRPADREFGRQGWLLVAAIVVAFGAVPLTIALRPPDLPFVVAYLVLPLVPAGLLALLAVYVTTTR